MANAPATTPANVITVHLRGRVALVTQKSTASGTLFLTLINTPAADEFSSPGTFELLSSRRLGNEGQAIEVEAVLQGYADRYERKSDGAMVRTARHVLRVV